MARKIGILKEFLPALLPKYKIMLLEAFSPCDGEPQGRAVGIGYLPLYESFAERAASDDRTPVVVLDRKSVV